MDAVYKDNRMGGQGMGVFADLKENRIVITGSTHGLEGHPLYADIPLNRHASPEEVAGLSADLASQEAAYITGQAITIDVARLQANI